MIRIMMQIIGFISGIIATYVVCSADIAFSVAQATADFDKTTVTLGSIAMSLSGMTIFFFAKIYKQENGWSFFVVFMFAFGVALGAYKVFQVQGYFMNIDMEFSKNSSEQKLQDLSINLAQAKLLTLETGKIDTLAATAKLAKLEGAAAKKEESASNKCKFWQRSCKNKELEGSGELAAQINAINRQLDSKQSYVSAIDDAQKIIKNADKNEWKKTHRAYQNLARIFFGDKERALDAQGYWRFIKAFFWVTISYLSFMMFADNNNKISGLARQLARELNQQPPRPTPQTEPQPQVQQRTSSTPYTTFGRGHNPHFNPNYSKAGVTNEIVESFVSRVNARNTPEQQRGILEINEDAPATSTPTTSHTSEYGDSSIGFHTHLSAPSSNIPRHTRLDTPSHTQTNTVDIPSTPKKPAKSTSTAAKGKGATTGMACQAIKDDILKGVYFKHEDIVGTHALRRYTKSLDSGIGQEKAAKYVQKLKEDGVPMNKAEWEKRNATK